MRNVKRTLPLLPFLKSEIKPKKITVMLLSLALLLLFLKNTSALMGDSDEAFGLDADLRSIAAGFENYIFDPFFGEDNGADGLSQTLLRIIAAGHPDDRVAYEAHAVHSYNVSTSNSSTVVFPFSLTGGDTRYRALDISRDWLEEDDVSASLWMDRFNVRYSYSKADITIGRQAITFGKAYFWNPLDIFLPFDPSQFDRDYKAGADALRIDIPFGNFSGINLIGALGRELDVLGNYVHGEKTWDTSWYGAAVLTRFFTTLRGWDLALQGGKIYGGYQLGGGVVGEAGTLEVRGEATYLFAEESPPLPSPFRGDLVEDHFTAVLGLGHRFENSLTLESEYLYNGSGDPDNRDEALLRLASGGSLHLGKHLCGVMASYEILPILLGQASWLYSFSDQSSQIQTGLIYSAADEVDVQLGALINTGDRPRGTSILDTHIKSEFGTFPNIYFLEFKIFF